jgi:hypothetical protein
LATIIADARTKTGRRKFVVDAVLSISGAEAPWLCISSQLSPTIRAFWSAVHRLPA